MRRSFRPQVASLREAGLGLPCLLHVLVEIWRKGSFAWACVYGTKSTCRLVGSFAGERWEGAGYINEVGLRVCMDGLTCFFCLLRFLESWTSFWYYCYCYCYLTTTCFRLLLVLSDICVLLLLRTEMASSDTGLVRRSLSIVRKRAQTLQEKVAGDEELPCR
jgi:hypothetical protein